MKMTRNPEIHVGIVLALRINFWFEGSFGFAQSDASFTGELEASVNEGSIEVHRNGNLMARAGEFVFISPEETSSFGIREVVIGIGFHWEQKEDQVFRGALKLMVSDGAIQAVNLLPVEEYLVSVISSEMRGDSAPALLKAHTIISRSWLLAQIEKQELLSTEDHKVQPFQESKEEVIRWYDREDHTGFHVCADDHCQRYQGITRASNPEVKKAVNETVGEVLEYKGAICDARFSKCCGGVTETFENCWEPVAHPYLQRLVDAAETGETDPGDLKIETNASRFISGRPDAFCNTHDARLLSQVLNDYDQDSDDFYRWKVVYTQEELSKLVRERSGIDFGEILDLVPVERGESGRLVKLKIVGAKRTLTVGKELEIRRWLSQSHLYSSAFTVDKGEASEGVTGVSPDGVPGSFTLHGAGWGHGVGLCQIGAAVMAGRGYTHQEILKHYFFDTIIQKRYESTGNTSNQRE